MILCNSSDRIKNRRRDERLKVGNETGSHGVYSCSCDYSSNYAHGGMVMRIGFVVDQYADRDDRALLWWLASEKPVIKPKAPARSGEKENATANAIGA